MLSSAQGREKALVKLVLCEFGEDFVAALRN